jgi:hypothetical protein
MQTKVMPTTSFGNFGKKEKAANKALEPTADSCVHWIHGSAAAHLRRWKKMKRNSGTIVKQIVMFF